MRANIAALFSFRSERSFAVLSALAVASCLLAGMVLCLNVLNAPLSIDEYMHAHYLWLTSIGRIPHVDFWCHYPALGYVLTLPYFRLFPESIYTVFALRFLALSFYIGTTSAFYFHARNLRIHWMWGVLPLAILAVTPDVFTILTAFRTDAYAALLAIAALAIMFNTPTFLRSSLAASLSVLSVVIMPKYIHPLFFANLAYLGYGCLKLKRVKQALLSAVTGISTTLILSHGLLLTAGTNLREDIYWSPLFLHKYFLHCARTLSISAVYPVGGTAVDSVVIYFSHYWWVGAILALGVAGWLVVESKKRDVRWWVGAAVIIGVILFWVTNPFPFRQYLVPGLLCLALFAPYTTVFLKNQTAKAWGCLLLIALLTQTSLSYTQQVAADMASGKSFSDFAARQALLNLIPRSEQVVGFCESHPCFREDLTFMTFDEIYGNPPGFTSVMQRDSAAWKFFQPGHLAKRLEQNPPASIALMLYHYPPGWNEVLTDFLYRNTDKYEMVKYLDVSIAIRKDLVKASLAEKNNVREKTFFKP